MGLQLTICIPACCNRTEINCAHGINHRLLRMAIGHWGNIRDHGAADQIGPRQSQHHHRLASHRMANHIGTDAMRLDHLGQIIGQIRVAVTVIPWACAMIAHINGEAMPFDPFRNHTPIAR